MLQLIIANPNVLLQYFTILCPSEYNKTTDEIIQQSKPNSASPNFVQVVIILCFLYQLALSTSDFIVVFPYDLALVINSFFMDVVSPSFSVIYCTILIISYPVAKSNISTKNREVFMISPHPHALLHSARRGGRGGVGGQRAPLLRRRSLCARQPFARRSACGKRCVWRKKASCKCA